MKPAWPPGHAVAGATGEARTADLSLGSETGPENSQGAAHVKRQPLVACKVYGNRREIGGVIETAAGYVAWWKGGRLGGFDTYGAAGNAVRAAVRADARARKGLRQ